jgi:hypothetical protein
LKEGETQEVPVSQTVESTDENLEHLTVGTEPEAEQDPNAVLERPQLTASALKEGLQMMDNSVISLMLKISENSGMRSPYKEVYKDMQKKVKQSKITSFFTQSSIPPTPWTLHCSLTLTTLSQEHRCHSSIYRHTCSCVY